MVGSGYPIRELRHAEVGGVGRSGLLGFGLKGAGIEVAVFAAIAVMIDPSRKA